MSVLTHNFTTNETSDAANIPTPFNQLTNKLFTIYAWGTFGGGLLTVEVSPNGTDWFELAAPQFLSKGLMNIEIKALQIRVKLTGATTPNLNVVVH